MRPVVHDAVIVGAGFAGIGAAIQLKRMQFDDFVILEREDDLGGTWYVNHYPGLAVDVPTTSYSYFFGPNPNWSRLFSTGTEIKDYADDVADKYDVRRHIRVKTTVTGAHWDADDDVWRVSLADGEQLRARFLITATGFLSQPPTPDIPGITEFDGKILHTTDWDDEYPLHGRRVAVIYALRVDTAVLRHRYFRRLNIAAADLGRLHLAASIRDRDLRRKLTPDYDFGCKRPTFSNDYHRAFTKPHVQLQADGIDRIEPDGIVNADGSRTVIDTLVLATGFDLWEANFPAIEVIGRGERNLGKRWRETRFQAHQGVSMPHFPNYLSLTGPYAFLGLNFFSTMEFQMRLMERLFGEVKRRGARTFEVTEDANRRYLNRMTDTLGDSLFTLGNCTSARSYYFNPSGEATLLRPMTTRRAVTEASRFPLSDYTFA